MPSWRTMPEEAWDEDKASGQNAAAPQNESSANGNPWVSGDSKWKFNITFLPSVLSILLKAKQNVQCNLA